MIEVSFGAFVVFGIIWAIQLFAILEMLSITRETRSQLHTAVKKFAVEFNALRQAHEDHISGKPAHSDLQRCFVKEISGGFRNLRESFPQPEARKVKPIGDGSALEKRRGWISP